ncbi:MAG: transcriptional regulator TbsP [Halanaeroarchaeum sp.]
MTATLSGTSVAGVLEATLADDPATITVVNPSARVFERVVRAAVDVEGDLPSLRVVGDGDTLSSVLDDFLVASTAANLVEADVLSLRDLATSLYSTALVTEDRVVVLFEVGDAIGGLATEESAFVASATAAVDAEWDRAAERSVRTPAISRVYETLASTAGEEVRADFEAMLDSLDSARGEEGDLDEVTVSLLVAGMNGVLLYDVSRWGEDVGIASKATFSRTKTHLEDVGLLETEKVPIDVGRPRLRLRLAADLPEGDPAAVAEIAIERLSA